MCKGMYISRNMHGSQTYIFKRNVKYYCQEAHTQITLPYFPLWSQENSLPSSPDSIRSVTATGIPQMAILGHKLAPGIPRACYISSG